MPGLSTHYLFGVKTLKYINGLKLHKLILNYPCAYTLGQQGPDLLFYYPHIFKRDNLGVRMHNEGTSEFFYSMLYYIENYAKPGREKDIMIVYLTGFLGHYVIDKTFHPYVYAYSMEESGLRQQGRHFKLEAAIDAYLLKTIKKIHPVFFKAGKTLALSLHEETAIIEMLQYAVFYTYGKMLGKRRLKISFGIMRFVHALLCIFHRYLKSEASNEFLNIARKSWSSPWDKEKKTASVPDMLKLAKSEYVELLKELDWLFADGGNERHRFMENVGNYSYRTGKQLV